MTAALVILAAVCAAQLALIAFLLHEQRGGQGDVARELAGLANDLARRVQAPQVAAVELANQGNPLDPGYAPQALVPDDDDAFWESREQLAERMMREEVEARDRGTPTNGPWVGEID